MRKLVIDRFDGKYAICEGEGKDGEIRKFAIPMQEVPKDASEGVCIVINDEGEIIVVTDKGYAKRSLAVEYELSVRARKGLKTFDFKKTGSNGSEIAGAVWVREPFDMYLLHQSGEIETLNTDSLLIESRLSPGKPYVLVVMGDIITEVVKDNS